MAIWKKFKTIVNYYRLNVQAALRKKKLARSIVQSEINHLMTTVTLPIKWYGSGYGGFYICPQFLTEKSIVYSFGIGKDISFDKKCMQYHSCEVFGFDPTPVAVQWVKDQDLPDSFHFYEYGLSRASGSMEFFVPLEKISGSLFEHHALDKVRKIMVDMLSLNDIVLRFRHQHIDVLKMDIEGAEYDVLLDAGRWNVSVDQLLVEFHDRMFPDGVDRSRQVVKILRELGYQIFAASESFEEVSFIHERLLH
ncbi:MAG: FkbM family methyltransferase [Saprospiraceae bacterium]|nr:FkbM family methyltransferase [Saprospiraceae bacterium]